MNTHTQGRYLNAQNPKLDVRDLQLGKLQTPVILPINYQLDIHDFVQNFQWQFGTCGAHGGSHLMWAFEKKRFSPRFLWNVIKNVIKDGYGLDEGTDMKSIFKALQVVGDCTYDLLPNDYPTTLRSYSSPKITKNMRVDAEGHKIQKGYGFTMFPTVYQLKQDVYQNKAVGILIRCDDGFFGSKYPTFNSRPYGHFVIVTGFDDSTQEFTILDSTEPKYPIKYINYKYITYIRQVGTAVEVDPVILKKLKETQLTLIGVLKQFIISLQKQVAQKLAARR